MLSPKLLTFHTMNKMQIHCILDPLKSLFLPGMSGPYHVQNPWWSIPLWLSANMILFQRQPTINKVRMPEFLSMCDGKPVSYRTQIWQPSCVLRRFIDLRVASDSSLPSVWFPKSEVSYSSDNVHPDRSVPGRVVHQHQGCPGHPVAMLLCTRNSLCMNCSTIQQG